MTNQNLPCMSEDIPNYCPQCNVIHPVGRVIPPHPLEKELSDLKGKIDEYRVWLDYDVDQGAQKREYLDRFIGLFGTETEVKDGD